MTIIESSTKQRYVIAYNGRRYREYDSAKKAARVYARLCEHVANLDLIAMEDKRIA